VIRYFEVKSINCILVTWLCFFEVVQGDNESVVGEMFGLAHAGDLRPLCALKFWRVI
jgi:hypothetical protein